MTIDAWMQHPTQRFLRQDAFESLRRWTGQQIPEEEMVAVARKHENVYIDTSAHTAKRYPPELVRSITAAQSRSAGV